MLRRALASPPLAVALTLALTGCVGSSRPSRLYTLAPTELGGAATTAGADVALAVGPVELPGYVDRRQIVTRAGAHELVVAEFDRWAGSLEEEITRTLVAVLADRLAPRKVAVAPWRSAGLVPAASTYRAAVSISRFDGRLGGAVVLRGRWTLRAEPAGASALLVREVTVTEQADGDGYDALVAAMGRAVVRFGAELAEAVTAAAQVAKAP